MNLQTFVPVKAANIKTTLTELKKPLMEEILSLLFYIFLLVKTIIKLFLM